MNCVFVQGIGKREGDQKEKKVKCLRLKEISREREIVREREQEREIDQ